MDLPEGNQIRRTQSRWCNDWFAKEGAEWGCGRRDKEFASSRAKEMTGGCAGRPGFSDSRAASCTATGEEAGAGALWGVEHALLPQEQHWQIVSSSTECGDNAAMPCVSRRTSPKRMWSVARI